MIRRIKEEEEKGKIAILVKEREEDQKRIELEK